MPAGFSPRFFDPAKLGKHQDNSGTIVVRAKDNTAYAYSTRITLAINVARATSRPIFIVGAPGTGKTTLARNAAYVLGWRYYKYTVTSRTKAKDLMWSFDSLRRLSHAQEGGRKKLPPRAAYVQPHALWWAFDPESAGRRGATPAEQKRGVAPAADPAAGNTKSRKAVVLLDEIDKADPDVPNDLLEVLDERRFTVDELDVPTVIEGQASDLLVMITSNRERDMPPAFLRRCVVLVLDDPNADWLVTIANDRYGAKNAAFHRALADKVMEVRREAQQQDARGPSTAEYLDAVAACSGLDIGLDSPKWQQLSDALLRKREQPPEQALELAEQ